MAGSRKYKNKLCVYCRINLSTTADHVFSREFFQIEQRHNLPKVPSCEECNNIKSKLEHYLTAVLPFGATHENAGKALNIDVRKRLKNNNKLFNQLQNSMRDRSLQIAPKCFEERLTFKYSQKHLDELVAFIGKGLNWYHFNKYLPLNCPERIFTPSPLEMDFVAYLLNLRSDFRVNENLGDGTIRYRGLASETDEGVSVWIVQFLGGITISDAESNYIFKNSFVTMITGFEVSSRQ